MKTKYFLFLLFLSLVAGGCIQINMYEKQVPIPAQKWHYDYVPEFQFEIRDTTSKFLIYVTIRHTDLYQFNNLWLRIGSQAPGDTMKYQKINLQLAEGGAWDGTGVDDIYEVRKLISAGPVSFRKAGTYTFRIAQIMRENPLRYILNVGIRIEQVDD